MKRDPGVPRIPLCQEETGEHFFFIFFIIKPIHHFRLSESQDHNAETEDGKDAVLSFNK